jgi:hypothetical protein
LAITSTAPVLASSATTEPLRPASARTATCWARAFSVVVMSLPSFSRPSSDSNTVTSSVSCPVSSSLRERSRPARPRFVNE